MNSRPKRRDLVGQVRLFLQYRQQRLFYQRLDVIQLLPVPVWHGFAGRQLMARQ